MTIPETVTLNRQPLISIDEIQLLESCAFNAWPALRTFELGDWIIRVSGGYTKRANSANAIKPSSNFDGVIDAVELLYRENKQSPIFRISPLAPSIADERLAGAGYRAFDPSLVLIASLAATEPHEVVNIDEAASDEWLAGFAQANGVADAQRVLHDTMIAAIARPCAFATLCDRGKAIAYGLAVLEGSTLGLFDIVVAPERRHEGNGRTLVNALLSWGQRCGATRAYLQVRQGNDAAKRLYASFGFVEAYRYHYRIKDA